jgi:hypothetical protein
MQLFFALAVGLGHLTHLAQAVCPGPLNTAAGCNLGTPFTNGDTVYYDPADTMNVGANYVANGKCDKGSFAPATLVFQGKGGQKYDCGCLSLKGTFSSPLRVVEW